MPYKAKKKSEEKNSVLTKLPEKVKEKLGISFENFTQMIVKDEYYEQFLTTVKNIEGMKKI